MLYPYVDGRAVDTERMKSEFASTWDWLSKHRDRLSKRLSARRNPGDWWQPARPGPPAEMLSPKIVFPKVFLLPRFAVDISGNG